MSEEKGCQKVAGESFGDGSDVEIYICGQSGELSENDKQIIEDLIKELNEDG